MVLRQLGKVSVRVDDLNPVEAKRVDDALHLMKRIKDREGAVSVFSVLALAVFGVALAFVGNAFFPAEWSPEFKFLMMALWSLLGVACVGFVVRWITRGKNDQDAIVLCLQKINNCERVRELHSALLCDSEYYRQAFSRTESRVRQLDAV